MYCFSDLPLEEIKAMVERNPQEPDPRLALIEHHILNDDFDEALAQACLAADVVPEHPEILIWKAVCIMQCVDLLEGSAEMQHVIHKYPCLELITRLQTEMLPLFPGLVTDPGQIDWQELDEEIDDEDSRRVVEQACDRTELIHAYQVNPSTIIPDCEAYLDKWPQDVSGKLVIARIYLQSGLPSEAEVLYRDALAVNPEATIARFELGMLLPDPHEAIEQLELGLQTCSFDQRARCKLAERLMEIGELDQARNELRRVPADSMFYVAALSLMCDSWIADDDLTAAVGCLEKAVGRSPGQVELESRLDSLRKELPSSESS
ncbi:MAG: tetratricopeptide repeat protein [Pirellulaceae bacterium]